MDEPTEKVCLKCSRLKPIGDYYVRRGKPQARCKTCVLEQNKAYADAHPETSRAAVRRWRERNPDKARDGFKRWYEANKDYNLQRVLDWRRDNPEAWRALQARWRDTDERREDARLRSAEWRQENPDLVAEWVAANADKILAKRHRRRARKNAAPVEKVDLRALWVSQCGICALCGERIDDSLPWPDPMSRSLDHRIPLARGGSHTRENLQYVHLVENLRKGARLSA